MTQQGLRLVWLWGAEFLPGTQSAPQREPGPQRTLHLAPLGPSSCRRRSALSIWARTAPCTAAPDGSGASLRKQRWASWISPNTSPGIPGLRLWPVPCPSYASSRSRVHNTPAARADIPSSICCLEDLSLASSAAGRVQKPLIDRPNQRRICFQEPFLLSIFALQTRS